MIKLVIEDDEGRKQEVPLDKEEMMIGRGPASHIHLDEVNVSRQHAILSLQDGKLLIEDFSRYGTRLNGRKLEEGEPQPFYPGDLVIIGDYKLRIEDPEGILAPKEEEGEEKEEKAQEDGGEAEEKVERIPSKDQPRLVVVSSNFAGKEFFISKKEMMIGRTDENDIVLDEGSISRHHAKITALENGRFHIKDMGSSNGMKVNKVEVKEYELSSGDIVELGQVRMRYCSPGEYFNLAEFIKAEEKAAKNPLMLYGAIGIAVLIVVVILVIVLNKGEEDNKPEKNAPKAQVQAEQAKQKSPEEILAEKLQEAKTNIEEGQGDLAIQALELMSDNAQYSENVTFKSQAPEILLGYAKTLLSENITFLDREQNPPEEDPKFLIGNAYAPNVERVYQILDLVEKIDPENVTLKDLRDDLDDEEESKTDYEELLQSIQSKDLDECISAREGLKKILEASVIVKAKAEADKTEEAIQKCIYDGFTANIEDLAKNKKFDEAKAELQKFKQTCPTATKLHKKLKRYIENKKNPKPSSTSQGGDKPKSDPNKKAKAQELATEAQKNFLNNPGKAVKLYQQSLKLYNDRNVRKKYAQALERAQQPCKAAKQWAKVGNKKKAEALKAKNGCP